MIEMFSICSAVMTPSRAPVSVWIISRDPVTVTVSLWVPTSRRTSAPAVSFVLMRTPRASWVLNPLSSTLRV